MSHHKHKNRAAAHARDLLHRALDFLSPARTPGSGDRFFLKWAALSICVLLAVLVLMLSGATYELGLQQVRFLAGEPFYIDAAEAQVDLVGSAGMFGICVLVTFYMALLLLRERYFIQRLRLVVLALVAAGLPGILCVLWHGVLNVSAPLACIILAWLGAESKPLAKKLYYRHIQPRLRAQ